MAKVAMSRFIQYEHHGELVWVRRNQRGKHRQHCLCYNCRFFVQTPDPEGRLNCSIAAEVYKFCVENKITTPVWECKHFEEKE